MYRPKYLNSATQEHVNIDCFADYFSKQFKLYGKSEIKIGPFSEDLLLDRDFTLSELDLVISNRQHIEKTLAATTIYSC
jgi:hypothetical protein